MAKAVAIGENLIRRWPGGLRSRRDVALARLELGTILIEMNLQPEANAEFKRADELAGSASDPDLRVHLEFMAQRSRILRLRGQPSEALELRRQVGEQREAIFRAAPESILWEYAGSLCSYGELLREMGKFSEAAKAYSKALPLIEEWAAEGPEELNRAWHQARENEEYAKALAGMGETEPAIARLDRAIASYRNILLREPDAMSDQRALAMCLTDRAQLEAKRGGSSRALRLIREAERLSEEAANRDAASWRAQTEFAGIHKAAAEIHR
jgi:tetratricopeptide (TPR) repeat protein